MVKKNNKKIIIDLSYISLVLLFFFIMYFIIFSNNVLLELFDLPTNDERPFVNVYGVTKDKLEEQIKIVLLSHPFTRDSSWKQYEEYINDNFLVLGISSYNEFPGISQNKLDGLSNPNDRAWKYDYMKVVKGWLHCFRNPDIYIKKGIPKELISESDFCNYNTYKPNNSIEKIYDFIYVCPKDSETDPIKKKDCNGWGAGNKNWKLGKKCIEKLCIKYKLKGFLVGREGCELDKRCEGLISTSGFLQQSDLIKAYNSSKFILMSNQSDASPRVLTEALCCNLPVLLNYNIVGGWKYINDKTGAFFTSVEDIDEGLNHILDNKTEFEPRKYFISNYGKENAGKKLKDFIQKNFSDKIDVNKYEYLKI